MAELSDIEGKALSDEERERLNTLQMGRSVSIAKKMLEVLGKHIAEIVVGEDEKKLNDSLDPIIEEILKMQREDGMMFIDRETVNALFLQAGAATVRLLEKHYSHAYGTMVEFRVGKPLYELTMQDIRSTLEERAEKLAPKSDVV